MLEMEFAATECGSQQEGREEELRACQLVTSGGGLWACVIGHNHHSLTFLTPLTTSAW
jgi:hypothetical protein